MSDEHDLTIEALTKRLTQVYEKLRQTSEELPIGIFLPKADGTIRLTQSVASIARACEISQEIPMPDEITDHLRTGYLHWLTAYDLLTAYTANRTRYRAEAVVLALTNTEDYIGDVNRWLKWGYPTTD